LLESLVTTVDLPMQIITNMSEFIEFTLESVPGSPKFGNLSALFIEFALESVPGSPKFGNLPALFIKFGLESGLGCRELGNLLSLLVEFGLQAVGGRALLHQSRRE
jgi:hypothetical protein